MEVEKHIRKEDHTSAAEDKPAFSNGKSRRKRSSLWLAVSCHGVALGGVLCALFSVLEWNLYHFLVFVLIFLVVSVLVWALARAYPLLKARATAWLETFRWGRRWLGSVHFRAGVTAFGGFLFNTVYGIFEGTLAILSRSMWYGALSAYHLCLSVMRFRLIFERFPLRNRKGREPRARHIGLYKSTGMILLLLAVVIAVSAVEMILSKTHFAYAGVMLLGVSVYAVVKMELSVRSFLFARRYKSLTLKAIRTIGIADALMSLFALQTALLSAFAYDIPKQNTLNGITGGVVCVIVASMGIAMVRGNVFTRMENKKN